MCRSRRDTLSLQPQPLSSSSSSSSSTTTIFSPTTNSILTNSSSSLPTLRRSLYRPSDISSAILHPRAQPLSPSSFRSSLLDRDVFIHRRQFRSDPSLLPSRLSHLCKSHHRSLVPLLAASLSSSTISLVYDFVPGASLAACLRNPDFTPLSSWLSRMHVAADLAQGLDYIHHHAAAAGLVHNRISSSAIIVSDAGHAKICYFGAAFLAGDVGITDKVVEGTAGYLAPEVIAGGRATGKSDVYAFGVVLLELMSGDEPIKCGWGGGGGKGYEWDSVVERGREVVGERERVRLWVDGRLRDSFPTAVAEKMVAVAVRCVEADVERRPGMGWVQGKISQLFLESKAWSEKMRLPVEISATFGPR